MLSNTSNASKSDFVLPLGNNKSSAFLIIMLTLLVIDIVGILGNILLVKVMNKSRSINRSYGIYLIALAMTDSMNILFNLIDTCDEFLDYRYGRYLLHKSRWSCRVYEFLSELFTLLSAWLIVCISCERFLVMYFPLKGRVWWKSHYVPVFIIVIAVGVATQAPRLYFIELDRKFGFCRFNLDHVTFVIAVTFDSFNRFFFVYAIPGTTVLILNILVILRMYGFVKRSALLRLQTCRQQYSSANVSNQAVSSVSTNVPPCVGDKTRRDRKRATGILVTISCTYLVCMAPESIVTFYWSLVMHEVESEMVPKHVDDAYISYFYTYRFIYQIFTAISYGSTFYTYVIFGKRFRKEVSSLWKLTSTSSTMAPPPILQPNHPHLIPLKHCHAYGVATCRHQPNNGDVHGNRHHIEMRQLQPSVAPHGNSDYASWRPCGK